MAMSEKATTILNYLKANNGVDLTAADVADALGLGKKSIDSTFTFTIQNKGLGYREEAMVEDAEGKQMKIKFLRLNDAGLDFDPMASEEAAD